MGLIRGFLLVIIAVLLFLSIISASLFWTLSLSLNYDNVQKQSTLIIKDLLNGVVNVSSIMPQYYPLIQMYCGNNSNLSYVFNAEGYTFDIPCSIVSQGPNKIIDEGIKNVISKVYYKDYDCEFLDCFTPTEPPLFLVSAKTYNYLYNKFFFFLTVSLILAVALFLLVEKKSNWPILVGGFLLGAFLLLFKIDFLLSLSPDKTLYKFLSIFFSESSYVALYALIAGVVLLILGLICKLFKLGFFFEKLVLKFKKAGNSEKKDKEEKKEISKKSK